MPGLVLICALMLPVATQTPTKPAIQTPTLPFHLPAESAGTGRIVRTLISAFDQFDVVALGEEHDSKPDSDLRIALVRNPNFAKRVRTIVVEFASTTEQSTLDRYIRGEQVSPDELAQVWKTTTQAANGAWNSPVYPEFFKAVRDVNAKLRPGRQIRVFGGDPGPGDNRSRETAAVDVIQEQGLKKHDTALVIYGAAHFYRASPPEYLASMGKDIGIVNALERDDPGRILSVIRIGWLERPHAVGPYVPPDFQKFDRAIKTRVRPVLLSLKQAPFRDFSAEELLGRTLMICRSPGGCRSMFSGTTLRLGQMADACVYFGGVASADRKLKPGQ